MCDASQSSPCSREFGEFPPSLTPMKRNDGSCSFFLSFLYSFHPVPFYFRVSCGIRMGKRSLVIFRLFE